MTTQAHSRSSYPSRAVGVLHQQIHRLHCILIVSREELLDLVGVAGVCSGDVVGNSSSAGELVEDDGAGDDVALRGDRVGEAEDGRGDTGEGAGLARALETREEGPPLVDLAPHNDTREASVGVLWEPVAVQHRSARARNEWGSGICSSLWLDDLKSQSASSGSYFMGALLD